MNFKDWRSSWNLPDQSSPASPIFKMAKWFADSISLFYSWNIFKQHLNLLLWRLIWNLSINCNQKRVRMGISYGRYKRSWCQDVAMGCIVFKTTHRRRVGCQPSHSDNFLSYVKLIGRELSVIISKYYWSKTQNALHPIPKKWVRHMTSEIFDVQGKIKVSKQSGWCIHNILKYYAALTLIMFRRAGIVASDEYCFVLNIIK